MNSTYLYRYRTGNEYDLINLQNNQIWLSNPLYFNDPYDCAIQISFSYICERMVYLKLLEKYGDIMTSQEIKQMSQSMCEPFLSNSFDKEMPFNIRINDILRNVAVACFASQYDNISMWGYYSNSHKGFCLGYQVKELSKIGYLNDVVYKDNFDTVYDEVFMNKKHTDLIAELTLLKATVWKHEREIRLLKFDNKYDKDQKGIMINNIKPDYIYIGAKILLDTKNKILNIAEKNGIRVCQLGMKNNQFQLYVIEE